MPQKKKRVTQQTLRRRRMTALAIIILLVIIIIYAVFSACSGGDEDAKGDSENIRTSTITSTSSDVQNPITQTTPVQTGTIMESVTGSQTSAVTTSADDENRVQSIELTFYTCELNIGDSTMPYVTMLPDTADLTEKWESSDESIATVDYLGNITALKAGVCYVTVTSVNNPEVYAQVKVNVMDENGLVFQHHSRYLLFRQLLHRLLQQLLLQQPFPLKIIPPNLLIFREYLLQTNHMDFRKTTTPDLILKQNLLSIHFPKLLQIRDLIYIFPPDSVHMILRQEFMKVMLIHMVRHQLIHSRHAPDIPNIRPVLQLM